MALRALIARDGAQTLVKFARGLFDLLSLTYCESSRASHARASFHSRITV
jgi:hypothetical protein